LNEKTRTEVKFAMKRRAFLKNSAVAALGIGMLPMAYWPKTFAAPKKKVLVLGIDGMDTHLSRQYMAQGILPNFKKLAQKGGMRSVTSSIPPQSPVAWSNFTVSAPPSVHGIYDFIHRDPKTMTPYLSTSRVTPPDRTLDLGKWRIPLSGGETENLRKGKPFWEYLAERDIPATIFKMPANFPCDSKKVDMVSGMGTPDLRGGYGNFTLFTTASDSFRKDMAGGKVIPISFKDQKTETHLPGPQNTLEKDSPTTKIPVTIWRDRRNALVRIRIQGHEFLLKEREWTDWFELSFPMLGPIYDVKGICKLYVKAVHPECTLYVSPINIDPADPALPVVSPERYGRELIRNVGYFYTQGFPEDTKALSEGVLDDSEYLDLGYQIIRERERLLDYELARFSRQDIGMLFFYFSSLDQDSHMYWRTIDPHSPLYDTALHREYGNTLKKLYAEMDHSLGKVLAQNDINDPNLTLMVMSDHGFTPFRRQVNLNTWLFENGYLALSGSNDIENRGYFENVNWSRTGAYNVGINSLYLNMRGREKDGIVLKSQRKQLLNDLSKDLLGLVDPASGKKAVSRIRIVSEEEQSHNPHAPDLIVGWNLGYRTSWESILGGFSRDIISDNLDKWSGDHCVDPKLVPAVLFSNKKITKKNPNLCDISATVLREFDITPNMEVAGKPLYGV
jgi:predicted AlkP superfamily phosphohydrolase/phosphomutase